MQVTSCRDGTLVDRREEGDKVRVVEQREGDGKARVATDGTTMADHQQDLGHRPHNANFRWQ